ncbi:hypothetical protein EXS45_00800 [Candidatus Nomurabacteria bacterium]|nr:hypothetical protein [Candidatus Nomurabacteria bacterium]
MRFILPLILIGISVTVFFVYSNPIYSNIGELRMKTASFNEALSNSKALESERDKLTTKDNSIDPNDKIRLHKLLPDNIDNIRLILEIEQIALPYSMILKDIKYSPSVDKNNTAPVGGDVQITEGGGEQTSQDYGIWDLEFNTTGTYDNFLNFTRDLQRNLRIVDISSIQFSSSTTTESNKTPSSLVLESYAYSFKIKTYWLKN